jgi:DHA1 family chloramphenicol resistance protein-like MFS transporter
VRVALVLAALVNGSTFATFAYLAVFGAEVADLPEIAVPGLLAAFGAGSFLGVTAAGRLGDGRWLVWAACALPAGWALLAATSSHAIPLFALALVQGALSFGVGSTLIGRVLRVASDAPALGGSFATAALNVGAFAGPLLAGTATETLGDYRAAAWISAALAVAAIAVLAAFRNRKEVECE